VPSSFSSSSTRSIPRSARRRPLGEQRDRGPDRAFDLAGPGVVVADGPLDEVGDEFEGRLLAGHLAFQLADALRDPVDSENVLDPVGHIAGDRDLDLRFRVVTLLLGGLGHVPRLVEPVFDLSEVALVVRPHRRAPASEP